MAHDWSRDRAQDDEANLEEAVVDDGAGDETRYALTPLGLATLGGARSFAGFGPCAAYGGSSPEPALTRDERRPSRTRRPRSTPLFG